MKAPVLFERETDLGVTIRVTGIFIDPKKKYYRYEKRKSLHIHDR